MERQPTDGVRLEGGPHVPATLANTAENSNAPLSSLAQLHELPPDRELNHSPPSRHESGEVGNILTAVPSAAGGGDRAKSSYRSGGASAARGADNEGHDLERVTATNSKKKKKRKKSKDGGSPTSRTGGVTEGGPTSPMSVIGTTPSDEPNPFFYDNHMMRSPLQVMKLFLVGVTLFPIRLFTFFLFLLIGWVICKLMTIGVSKEELHSRPLRRSVLRWMFRKCARIVLWCLGFWWVTRKGESHCKIPVHVAVDRLKKSFEAAAGETLSPQEAATEAERCRAACLALEMTYERTQDRRSGYHAPVMVANHFSLVDTVYLAAYHDYMAVGKEQLLDLPFFGGICKALQYIPVLRESADSRKLVSREISRRTRMEVPDEWDHETLKALLRKRKIRRRDIRRAATSYGYHERRERVDEGADIDRDAEQYDSVSCSDEEDDQTLLCRIPEPWQPLVIFPEATCTNGKALIQFKLGAFVPGVPIQPVTLQYPYQHFPQGWVGSSTLAGQVIKSMLQVYNRMEVHYLPIYFPSSAEKRDVPLFAQRVREVMAKDLGVPTTEHTFEDVQLIDEANLLRVPFSNHLSVAMGLPEHQSLGIRRAKEKLRQFAELDKDGDGYLNRDEFGIFLGLQPQGSTTASLLKQFIACDKHDEDDVEEGAAGDTKERQRGKALATIRANMALRDAIFDRWRTYRNSDHRRKAHSKKQASQPSNKAAVVVSDGTAAGDADSGSSCSSRASNHSGGEGPPSAAAANATQSRRNPKEEVIDFASFLACSAAQRIRVKRRASSAAAAAPLGNSAAEVSSQASFYLDEAQDEEMLYLVTMCFGSFDLDHDGQISQDEFRRGIQLICPSLLEMKGGESSLGSSGGPSAMSNGQRRQRSSSTRGAWVDEAPLLRAHSISNATGIVLPAQRQWDPIDALFYSADTDGDGMLQLEEFATFVQQHPAFLHHIVVTFTSHELLAF